MQRLREEVFDGEQPRAPSPNAPLRRPAGEGVPDLRQAVRVHAGVRHAREDPRAGLSVPRVREGILQAVAPAGAHPDAHG